jgi:hypothetical protein
VARPPDDAAATNDVSDLDDVRRRLEAILAPYRDRLVEVELYGQPFVARPGAKKHDWFAGVSPGNGVVRFFLLPMHHHPELIHDLSPRLRRRKTGVSLFSFQTIDDSEVAELEALVARAFAWTSEAAATTDAPGG